MEGTATSERADAWGGMATAIRDWTMVVGVRVDRLAIELPQVYHDKIETDQNDLIDLAAVVGATCARFPEAEHVVYLPAEWKGQTPKEIVHARMWKRLTPDEVAVVPRAVRGKRQASLLHNMYDGISIGLVDLGRLHK